MEVGNSGEDLLLRKTLIDLQYVNDIVLLCADTQAIQIPLDHLKIGVQKCNVYALHLLGAKCFYKAIRSMYLNVLSVMDS